MECDVLQRGKTVNVSIDTLRIFPREGQADRHSCGWINPVYARLRVTAAESGAFKAEDVPLGDVLSAWLHEDEILIFCQGVLTTVEVATKPFWTTAQEGCVHFLCDVFGRPFHEIVVKPKQTDDARTLWHRYLSWRVSSLCAKRWRGSVLNCSTCFLTAELFCLSFLFILCTPFFLDRL